MGLGRRPLEDLGSLIDEPHVVVLGATGFIGSWAIRSLLHRGIATTCITRPNGSPWRLEGLNGMTIVEAEVERWPEAILDSAPTTLVSLDWSGVAGGKRDDDIQWSNLDRVGQVLEAAASSDTKRFVGFGSQAEYGPQSVLIRETTAPAPRTVYAMAKLATLELSESFCAQHDIEWVWGRIFSTYGPLDNSHWLLPQVAESLLAGRDIDLSEGTQLWSYLYGPDAGDAIAVLALSDHASGIYNIGNPDAPVLRSTIEEFASYFDSPSTLAFGAIPFTPDSVRRLEPDVSRLESLGWRARVTYERGLRETAAWLQGESVTDPFGPQRTLPPPR